MEFYCPRCETSYSEIEQAALESGQCSTCEGQLSIGDVTVEGAVAGVVAMTFDSVSGVGQAMQPQLDTKDVDRSVDFDTKVAARTAELKPADENDGDTATDEEDEDEDDGADEAPSPDPSSNTADKPDPLAGRPTVDMEPLDKDEPAGDDDAPPPPDPSSIENAAASGEEEPNDANPDAAATDAGPLPAGLAAPSMDFSMPSLPDFGGPGAEAPSTAGAEADAPASESSPEPAAPSEAADTTGAEPAAPSPDPAAASDGEEATGSPEADAPAADPALPAHLQLPSFPKFDMSFDTSTVLGDEAPAPDAPPDAPAPAPEAEAAPPPAPEATPPDAPPDAPPQPPPEAAPPQPPAGMPAHLMPGQLPQAADAQGPGGLPALPGMPDLGPAQPEQAQEQAAPDGAMPSLPNFGLPNIGSSQPKEVTLLGDDAAAEVLSELQQKRSVLPIVVVSLVILGALVGVGFWQRTAILGFISPEKTIEHELTKGEQAEAALALGVVAAKGKKLKQAVKHYKSAIELNPELSAAHLRLAVAYATLKKEESAVHHYKRYVELEPKSKKRKEINKIISDWEKAQAKKSGSNGEEKDDGGKKKKRKKRR